MRNGLMKLNLRRYLDDLIDVSNVWIFLSVVVFVLQETGSTNYAQLYFGMLYNDGT